MQKSIPTLFIQLIVQNFQLDAKKIMDYYKHYILLINYQLNYKHNKTGMVIIPSNLTKMNVL